MGKLYYSSQVSRPPSLPFSIIISQVIVMEELALEWGGERGPGEGREGRLSLL